MVIRSLASDELEWFLATYYAFIGHSDPREFARRLMPKVKEHDLEADASFVMLSDAQRPLAGVYVKAPEPDEDDQNLYLSNCWFQENPDDLGGLVQNLLGRHPHEAVHLPLYNLPEEKQTALTPMFEAQGFSLERERSMEFALADLPPLGAPLVLEAWAQESDQGFRDVYTRAEGTAPSKARWAYLKRRRGKFSPDYWFIARETLDQEPVGYAFFGVSLEGVDGVYSLTEAGVLQRYRDSSDMLKRLMLSSMGELAAHSPFGRIDTTVSERDPKLIRIMETLGFKTTGRYRVLTRRPA